MTKHSQVKQCAIYVRVSTGDQDTTLQIDDLRAYAEARHWRITKVYEDTATGTNTRRPALNQLYQDARRRHFDVVLVWKLDRLFRSLKDCVNGLHELDELNVEFVSLKDAGLDMTTPNGRLMFGLLGAFSEFEASLIRTRVLAGLALAKKRGKVLGRPKKRDDAKIQSLREQGYSLRAIARMSNVSTTAVQRSLKRDQISPNSRPKT